MRRDDELRPGPGRTRHHGEEGERTCDRERGLGLVEHEEAVAAEAIRRERKERLAVRLRVQRLTPVDREEVLAVDPRGHVEEALGPQEERIARLVWTECRLQRRGQRVVRELAWPQLGARRAALKVELEHARKRFDNRRLAASVLADEERDRCVETHRRQLADGWDVERVVVGEPLQGDREQVRAGSEGAAVGLRHQRNTDTIPTMHGARTSAGR